MSDNTLNILKLQIKSWELEFSKKNFKKPSKEDINNAPSDIKESYKSYWKLKKLELLNLDSIKDDVWSASLNKSNLKVIDSKAHEPCIKNICDKIKQKSSSKRSFTFVSKKTLPSTEEIKSPTIQDEESSLEPSSKLEFNCAENIFKLDFKINRALTSLKGFKTKQSVNLISSSVGHTPPSKSLNFDHNLNEDWLERCNLSILNADTDDNPQESSSNFPVASSFSRDELQEDLKKPFDLLDSNQSNVGKVKNVDTEDIFTVTNHPLSHNILKEDICIVSNEIGELPSICETVCDKISISEENKLESTEKLVQREKQQFESKTLAKKQKLKKNSDADIQESTVSKKSLHLKRKISSGTLNENFVRLDIKKKKFSRGHRSVNIKKLKWNKWKQLKKSSGVDQSNVTGCFKCGQFGHWSKNCNSATYNKKEPNNEFEKEDIEDSPLPTLEEAAKLVKEQSDRYKTFKYARNHTSSLNGQNDGGSDNKVDEFSIFSEADDALLRGIVDPIYNTDNNGNIMDTPKAVVKALNEMGYPSFRKGQEIAVMRILSGLSTLIVLPTGSGKSLCYQLPAYIYGKQRKAITIVVSPLVSLMEDQVTGLPDCLHAVCLHSGMSDELKNKAMEELKEGKAQIVLLSPEAVISYGFCDKFLNSDIPPIAFVCIDEVHCLSQWSHNFRPSYLQLYKVLTQRLGVKCILGLTATATHSVIGDIITNLDLQSLKNPVIGRTNVPHNLHLSISRDKDKDRALIQLLNGERFHNCLSIIIYCIRRVETERLAALIRTCMQDEVETTPKAKGKASKKRQFLWTAEAYHAGLAPPRRRSIQKKFMTGKLRVVVATIAFGMGLDKPDVRAIIHYNMPKNFESYVQEIGRAGRDGLDSHCHLFLDSEKSDLWEQQRHIYSNGIDRHTLRKLLKKVFVPCKCSSSRNVDSSPETMKSNIIETNSCIKHEISFSINDTVQELDVKQENISTLLCYLELHQKKWIEILTPTYAKCSIRCYGGSRQMRDIALKNPSLAAAIALDKEHGKKLEKSSEYSFEIVKVASAVGCKSAILKRELKKLEWKEKRKTGVMVELSDLAFHILAPGDLSDEEMDIVLDFLHRKVVESEESLLNSLKLLFFTFQKYSSSHYWQCCDEVNMEHSEGIKATIDKYFDINDSQLEELKIDDEINDENHVEDDLVYVKQLIKDFICTHHDHNFTGRSIARIFHGISSPCFPPEVWGKVRKFWRCLLPVNFSIIMKMANEELRNFK